MLHKPLIFSEIEKPLKMAEHFYSSTMFCFQAQDDINKKNTQNLHAGGDNNLHSSLFAPVGDAVSFRQVKDMITEKMKVEALRPLAH